jgi:hypothetical protein
MIFVPADFVKVHSNQRLFLVVLRVLVKELDCAGAFWSWHAGQPLVTSGNRCVAARCCNMLITRLVTSKIITLEGKKETNMNMKMSMQSRVKRGQLMILVLAGGLAMGNGSVAWAGFFDACVPGQATIEVTQNTTVKDETVTLPGADFHTCQVNVADGVTLEFKNVRVTVTGDTSLRFEGGDNSRLLIGHSTFHACDLDVFGFGAGMRIDHSELKEPVGAGCDLMEIRPTGDLEILSSTLRTDTEMILAPCCSVAAGNTVTVQKSTLDATQTSFGYGNIFIGTGFSGTSLHTLVEKNDLTADRDIEIGAQQDTTVIKNDFEAGGSITITGSPCTSESNRPDVQCL